MRLPNAKRYAVTRADFPEQDWSVWEARKYTHPGLGRTVDTSYLNIWPCCIHCGTWICSSCWDFRRQRADRRVSQYCGKCEGRDGFFSTVRHGTRNPHTPDGGHLPRLPFVVPVMGARMDQLEKIGRAEYNWAAETLEATRGMTEAEAAAYIGQHPYVPTMPDWALLKYYKNLAAGHPGRDKLWENQVQDGMTEEEAVAAGLLPPKQVDLEEKRGWGVKQPDELEHRDPGYSADAQFEAEQVTSAQLKARELEEKLRVARAEQAAIMKKYPYQDGDVLVLGPDIFVNPDAEVICWKGENWVRQPEPSEAMQASPDPAWQRREAMDWAVRLVEKQTLDGVASNTSNALIQTADRILEWLTK